MTLSENITKLLLLLKNTPNSFCKINHQITQMTFELCDVMMLATADYLPRIYNKTSQLYVIYNIYTLAR